MNVVWRVLDSHVLWKSVPSSTLVTHADIFFFDGIYNIYSTVRGRRDIVEGIMGKLNGKTGQNIHNIWSMISLEFWRDKRYQCGCI